MFANTYAKPLEARVTEAKETWSFLEDVTFVEDEDGWLCLHDDVVIPHLNGGFPYSKGTSNEEIWHDIEEMLGVSVAWLMGEAKNPDGTNG